MKKIKKGKKKHRLSRVHYVRIYLFLNDRITYIYIFVLLRLNCIQKSTRSVWMEKDKYSRIQLRARMYACVVLAKGNSFRCEEIIAFHHNHKSSLIELEIFRSIREFFASKFVVSLLWTFDCERV